MLVGTPDSSRQPSISVRVFLVLSKSYTCLPCSLQVVSLIPSPLLFFSHAALGRMFLPTCLPSYKSPCLSLNCCACLCVLWDETYYPLHSLTLGYYHMLPYLPSYLFPTYLLIISPLPSFFPGLQHVARRARFLSSSLSFLTCSSILSQCFLHPHYSCYLWVLLGPKILLASHVFQFVSLFSQFFSLFLLHFTFLLILLSPLLFLSRL